MFLQKQNINTTDTSALLAFTMGNKNVYTVVFVVFLSIFFLECLNQMKPIHPDAGLNMTELVEKYGYPIETHEVVTEDGYILTLHRIPHGREKSQKKRTPVLLMHGLHLSAIDFVIFGPGKALGLLLADEGFDVWLGNARGTTWSRKHKSLNSDISREFWNFSMHEIGKYDVKAYIDYILTITNHDDLQYVGYSQGAMVFFILASERPEYAKKVKLVTALAPAMILTDPKSPVLPGFIYLRNVIEVVFEVFRFRSFMSNDSLISLYLRAICNENSIFVNLCMHTMFAFQGYNPEGTDKAMLSLIYRNAPAGVSPRQCNYILQLMASDDFYKYDFGRIGNLEKYGQEVPPVYDLSKAVTPVALYYSSNDCIVNIKNIEKLRNALPNVVKSYHVPLEKFNHDDFVHSIDAPGAVYESVIREMLKYK